MLQTPSATVMTVGVVFVVSAGKIVALLRDKGASKSTIVRFLSGTHAPAAESSRLEGRLADRRDARGDRGARHRGGPPEPLPREPATGVHERVAARRAVAEIDKDERVAMIPGVG